MHARARPTSAAAGRTRSPSALANAGEAAAVEVLKLDELLDALHRLDERAAQVVELRYFGGYTEPEVAGMLGISESTLRRDWRRARAFLMKETAP